MAGPIRISILANASQANRELSQTATTAEKISGRMSKLRMPATLALGAIGAGAKKAISSASDLNEAVSKTGVIFGKQAGGIDKFASGAATSLGQSKTAALDAATTFGLIGQKAGLGGKQTSDFSKKFVTLSSDLASFNNTSPEQAVEAIGAAMRGESEPIRKYGVMLDDATLKARAMKMGLIQTTKEALTPQQKALAASQEIMAQTTKAQGDFARTADGAANKQRIVAAQTENLSASLGQSLLPAYQSVLQLASRFTAIMAANPGAVKAVIAAVAGLAAMVLVASAAQRVYTATLSIYKGVTTAIRVATVAWRNAQFALNIAMAMNPVGVVIVAIIALVAVFVIAYKKSETFRRVVNAAWNGIKAATSAVWGFLKRITLATWNAIKTFISTQVKVTMAVVKAVWNTIKSVTRSVWSGIKSAISSVWNSIKSVVRSATSGVKSTISGAWNAVKSATASIWSAIKSAISRAIDSVMDTIRGIKGKVTGAFSGAASWLVSAGQNIIQGMINGVRDMAGSLVSAAKDVVGSAIKGAKNLLGIHSPSKVFAKIGEQTGQGLVLGMQRMSGKAKATASDLSRAVADGFQAPSLTLDARTAYAGSTGSGGAAGGGVTINVNVPPTADKAAIGREVQSALDAYYKQGGRRRA